MNKKQLTILWCGIIAIVLAGLNVIENYGLVCSYGFLVWVFIVAMVTSGLIYTLKSKSSQKAKDTIQDMRNDILKRKRFKAGKSDFDKDK